MKRMLAISVLLVGMIAAWSNATLAAEPLLGQLIGDLTGPDQKAQALARQLLPRQGPHAVPELIALLADKNPVVAKAAFDILTDIGNEASAPGHEDECKRFTMSIAPLLQPGRPRDERILGLRLLEKVMPAGWDVTSLGPISEAIKEMYQNDPLLREKVRTALERIATPLARLGLLAALKDADPAFKVDVLNSLAQMKDPKTLDDIKDLLGSSEPAVRVAAARALAWTGDPAVLKPVREVLTAADAATRFDATDALLRLTNAIENNGGNWQIAVTTYLDVLQAGEGVQKDAALAGLGRIGDGSCVGPILAIIKEVNVDPRTFLTGVRALQTMQGRDVAAQIVAQYPNLPPRLQQAILPALGSKQAPESLNTLKEAAAAADPAMRLAGIRGLANAGLSEGTDILLQAARTGSSDEKAAALAGLIAMADALREHGKKPEAGKAYLAVYRAGGTDTSVRERALEGLAACPASEAFDAVIAAGDIPELKAAAAKALTAIGGALVAAGQKEKALAAYDKVRTLNPSAEAMRSIAGQMRNLGANVDLSALLGIVTSWWVIGPFELGENNKGWDTDLIGEGKPIDLKKPCKSGDKELTWKHVVSKDDNGKVILRPMLADRDLCLVYAYAEITVDKDTNAVLRLGVDDSEKVWVNGKKVFELFVARPLEVDQDQVPVKLKAGTNTLLLKIWQNAMGWEFCLRITTPDGVPVPFVQKTE